MRFVWILNGCGLQAEGVTGGPLRFHAVSRRWAGAGRGEHILLTTGGGAGMVRGMGGTLPAQIVRASLVLGREPCKAFRLWSYLVTSVAAALAPSRLPCGDVVVTVSDYFCDVVPALLIKRRAPGARWIAWIHHRETHPGRRPGNPVVNRLMYALQGWSLRRIARHADEAWVLETEAGDVVREELLRLGMDGARIRRMRNGMELADVPAEDVPKRVDAAMVGVRPNKGMFDIVPVWREVVRRRPGTTLRLMGGMAGTAALEEEIRRAGLEGVISIFRPEGGWMDTPAYYKVLKEARVLFAPSREEGWGIAVCEAMACGLPVIGYDLPAYRRIYGDAMARVPVGDTATFASEICRALDAPDEFVSIREKGVRCAGRYGWDAIAEEDWARIGEART